jgi:hypothetical protein
MMPPITIQSLHELENRIHRMRHDLRRRDTREARVEISRLTTQLAEDRAMFAGISQRLKSEAIDDLRQARFAMGKRKPLRKQKRTRMSL